MYCKNCGKEINAALSFCNFCGARVGGDHGRPGIETSSFNLLIASVGVVPLLGIGVLIALLAVMKHGLGLRDEMIGIVVIIASAMLLIAESGLLFMLFRTLRMYERSDSRAAARPNAEIDAPDVVIKELRDDAGHGLTGGPASVTEHTTRTLDKVERFGGE